MKLTLVTTKGTFAFENVKPGAFIQKADGFEKYEMRVAKMFNANRDGAYFVSSLAGGRALSWSGKLIGSSHADYLTRRQAFLQIIERNIPELLKLETDDGLLLQAEVKVEDWQLPFTDITFRWGPYMVVAYAFDWRFYSQELFTDSTPITTGLGGTPIPTPVPMTLAGSSGTPTLIIDNGGNEITHPVLRVYGPGTDFVVQNLTTGQQINLNTTLPAGQYIEIDCNARTILLNGTSNVYGVMEYNDADFFYLEPSENEIYFNATSGTSAETELEVDWRDAFLGI